MMNQGTVCAIGCVAIVLFTSASRADEDSAAPAGNNLRFAEHLIADGYGYSFGLAAGDLDGDGDVDITSSDVRGGKSLSTLYWYDNQGHGEFRRHIIFEGEPGWFERHALGDITGDGRPDAAVVNNRDGQILWFANSDRPHETWQRFVITTECTRAYDVVLVDLDNDGDLDAAASGYASGKITWYENPGPAGWNRQWPQRVIDERMPEARNLRIGDFNGDGRADLLAASVGVENVDPSVTDFAEHGSSVVWYENPGRPAGAAWPKHVIDDRSRAPIHGQPFDLDGDGDLDVVMAFGMRDELVPADRHEVAWYENNGQPQAAQDWTRHTIGRLPYAFEAVVVDLDDDGDNDVVATAWSKGDRLVWFENTGDASSGWLMHSVRENWPAANQLVVADFDGDGKVDVAAGADNGSRRIEYKGANELRWWRNEGRGK